MNWIRLFDPERKPAHWSEIARPGQFVVFVADAESRSPRDPDARPFHEGPSAALCNDLTEAREFARDTVARHPELCCEIHDYLGKTNPPVETVFDSSVRDRYTGRKRAKRQMMVGAFLICAGIVLSIIDFRHHLTWLWGYIIGLKCLILGVTQMTQGFAEWHECRDEV